MNEKSTISEYKIGNTTYIVKTTFNPEFHEGKLCYYDFIIGKLMKNGNYHQFEHKC